ncbi:hypothetical protein ACHAXT_000823 [Thalassiosira profunda]
MDAGVNVAPAEISFRLLSSNVDEAAGAAPIAVEKKATPEWPDDDDDDDSVSPEKEKSVPANEGSTDIDTEAKEEKKAAEDAVKTLDGEGAGKESPEKKATPELPDDDDDVDAGKANLADKREPSDGDAGQKEAGDKVVDEAAAGEKPAATEEWPDDDDEPDAKMDAGDAPAEGEEKEPKTDLEGPGEDASTAYHRNQSSGGDDAEKNGVESEGVEGATPEAGDAATQEGDRTQGGGSDAGAEKEETQNAPGGTEGGDGVPSEGDPNQTAPPAAAEENQQPPNQEQVPDDGEGYWEDDDSMSFFEMVGYTVQILFLAAIFTSVLVFRKRVMERVEADPSIGVPGAMKDEVIDIIVNVATWAVERASGAGGNGADGGGSAINAPASSPGNARGGSETIPLSTATDEEWGWEDEDVETNVELSGMGGDEAKEDDDLAMAIAMSLSESEGGKTKEVTASDFSTSSSTTTPVTKNHTRTKWSPKRKEKKQPVPIPESAIEPPSSSGGSDSIEDLLGQMGGAGRPTITSFGQKPKAQSKPKPVPKKENSDDIFASMGLASIPKPTSSVPRPAPATGGWQAQTQPKSTTAPKSALLPSLAADDDWGDEADWGEGDDDLDDLLDD